MRDDCAINMPGLLDDIAMRGKGGKIWLCQCVYRVLRVRRMVAYLGDLTVDGIRLKKVCALLSTTRQPILRKHARGVELMAGKAATKHP